jgi:CHASE2 domain-containing sensor protein
MKYYDFDIWIASEADGHFSVRARSESMGEDSGKITAAQFVGIREALERLAGDNINDALLREVGGLFYGVLFSGAVGSLFQKSLGQVYADPDRGVRIRLRIEPPDVAALPWELAYDASRKCFLATSSETPFTRYIELPVPVRDLKTALPIRVLVVIPGGSGLDVDQEERMIRETLAHMEGAVELTVLKDRVRSSDINHALILSRYHVLHFIGHGGFSQGRGCLLLNDDAGGPELLSASEFSFHFQDYPSMKLIVLNSCSGAASSPQALTGVAHELVQMGVPAVVAMSKVITDEAAKLFAENFYLMLCASPERGRVDIAVSHARKRLAAEMGGTESFSIPVLFMRSPKGVIFDATPEGARIESVRELHTNKAVSYTYAHNIDQLQKEGGPGAADEIAQEARARTVLRARVRQFYKRMLVAAAPRVVVMALGLAAVIFLASHTRVFNAFRVDDYAGGALRLWRGDSADEALNKAVRLVMAEEGEGKNGELGNPVGNRKWREYHAKLIDDLSKAGAKAIVFDLTFEIPGGDVDTTLAGAVNRARERNVSVVGAQKVENNGELVPGYVLNPALSSAFGENWGDVRVGGLLEMPTPFSGVYVNEYEVASLQPGDRGERDDSPLTPSLALRAVMQYCAEPGASPRALYDRGANEVRLENFRPDCEKAARIPVSRSNASLNMLIDYAPSNKLKDATKDYKDVYDLATSDDRRMKEYFEGYFRDTIVVIGYNTDSDRHRIIGEGMRPGVAIHANAISNLLNGVYIPQAPDWCNFLAIAAMAGLGVLLQTKLQRLRAHRLTLDLPYFGKVGFPVLFLSTLILYLVVAYYVYSRSRVSFDMSYHVAALLFAYWLVGMYRRKLGLN